MTTPVALSGESHPDGAGETRERRQAAKACRLLCAPRHKRQRGYQTARVPIGANPCSMRMRQKLWMEWHLTVCRHVKSPDRDEALQYSGVPRVSANLRADKCARSPDRDTALLITGYVVPGQKANGERSPESCALVVLRKVGISPRCESRSVRIPRTSLRLCGVFIKAVSLPGLVIYTLYI